jgi:hypothetical protein
MSKIEIPSARPQSADNFTDLIMDLADAAISMEMVVENCLTGKVSADDPVLRIPRIEDDYVHLLMTKDQERALKFMTGEVVIRARGLVKSMDLTT